MATTKKASDSEQSSNVTEINTDEAVTAAVQNPEPEAPTVQGKSTGELANDVLHGRFGDFNVVRENLDNAGADSSAVLTVVNERLSRGAPASYRPNVSQVLDSARRGEWGTENIALRVRAAGYSEADARHVESSLNQES